MKDYNGKEIRTGDFVRISGAYFKNSNGLYLVARGDDIPLRFATNSLWLARVKKSGELCVSSATSNEEWPIRSYCNDARKNREAKAHNAEHAKIEIADGVPTYYAAAFFREEAKKYAESAERQRERGREEEADEMQKRADVCAAAAERLAKTAEQPKQKEPEKGVRFLLNGIKVDGGRLVSCWYSVDENSVTIYANDYGAQLPRDYFTVKNDTDSYTDYFCKDSATLTPEHPLYRFARFVALKGIMKGKTYHKPTPEQTEEWARMSDPGQPTAADFAAVEEMKTAAESARIAAEHAEQLAEREKMLRKRSEGRQFIEQTAAKYPIKDGAPTVEIPFSENPAFYSWTESRDVTRTEITINADGTQEKREIVEEPRRRLILSVAAAEIVLKHFDEEVHAEQRGYDKTDFIVRWSDAETGEEQSYEGRYDLGDNDGGLIAHIRAFGQSTLHDEKQREEICALADMLEQYTECGRVVDVRIDEKTIDFAAARKKKAEEQAKLQYDDILAAVGFLTDEQIEEAIMLCDPKDKDKLDVARFFLQEMMRRDEKRAIEVFKRWQAGA